MTVWIPGHVGVSGNDKADKLAQKAVSTEPITIQDTFTSKNKAKTMIKHHCREFWEDECNLIGKESHR